METSEQLVDALIEAAMSHGLSPTASNGETVDAARAALLAAMGGDGDQERQAYPLIGNRVKIEHDGFSGTIVGHYRRLDGYEGAVLQQDGTKVVHVYGLRHLREDGPPAAMGGDAVPDDPNDLWDDYCEEVSADRRSPQGALAFAFERLAFSPSPSAIAEGREVDRVLAAAKRLEARTGAKFTVDPERLKQFAAHANSPAAVCQKWLDEHGESDIQFTSPRDYAVAAVTDIMEVILALPTSSS